MPAPGGAMASNPRWCQPLATWGAYFREWMAQPTPTHVLASSMYFDLRPVVGDASLGESLAALVRDEAPANRRFLTAMASDVVDRRVPVGLLGGIQVGCGDALAGVEPGDAAAPGDVQEDAPRDDAIDHRHDRVGRHPGRRDVVGRPTAVVHRAVVEDVADRVEVGDGEAVRLHLDRVQRAPGVGVPGVQHPVAQRAGVLRRGLGAQVGR